MKRPRLRAVVLAAGFGRRLWPLTHFRPKPLLPVAGREIAAHTLGQLARLGCEATALNLHYQGDAVRGRFGESFDGMPLHYSPEEPIQGTLGALAPLAGFLAEADLVVLINGDSLAKWPIPRMVRRHRRSEADATLMLSTRAAPEDFGGGVGVDLEGRVVIFGRESGAHEISDPDPATGSTGSEIDRRRVFAGCHVFPPRLLEGIPAEPSDIVRDLYRPLVARGGKIQAFETGRPWHDMGTPARYLEAALDWSRGRGLARWMARSLVSPEAVIGREAKLRGAVIEGDVVIGEGARVERSLVLPGARVGRDSRIADCIVGFDAALPAGTRVDRRLITPERADVPVREGDSVVGGLTYSPIVPPATRVSSEVEA